PVSCHPTILHNTCGGLLCTSGHSAIILTGMAPAAPTWLITSTGTLSTASTIQLMEESIDDHVSIADRCSLFSMYQWLVKGTRETTTMAIWTGYIQMGLLY
ncbi:hypothetical protein IL306_015210, partial [Fusarium sp. DS 682]